MSSTSRNVHRLINLAVKQEKEEAPIEKQFLFDLKSAIERNHTKGRRKPSKYYKPSSMKCVRNMYFQATGVTPDITPTSSELVGILESGTFRHDKIQEHIITMQKHGIDCEYVDVPTYIKDNNLNHLKVTKKVGHETKILHLHLNLSFMTDGIIKYKGEYYILEIKTETSQKFMKRQAIAEDHYEQAYCYAASFGIYKVLFLYENRDTSEKKTFLMQVTDEDIYKYVISKIEEADTYVNSATIPPKPKDIPKRICEYCNYRSSCRKAGN